MRCLQSKVEVADITNNYEMNNVSRQLFGKYISDYDYYIYEMVNYFIITSTISMFGVATNVVNIIVFYHQGFDNTMNISFFGLAISDLCSLLTILWFNLCISPLLVYAGVKMAPQEVQYLTAGLPHICFVRITSWITVFITAERSLCITLPLKIKQIITPTRTKVILCSIYLLIILSFEPAYEKSYFDWRFDIKRNTTIFGIRFKSNRKQVEGVTFLLFAILGFVSFITVIIFTLVLVIQLKRKSKWRQTATLETSRSEIISTRERKTIRMVVMIASVLIVCYTPGVAVSSVTIFESEFSIIGKYANIFFTSWSFVVIFESLNSSINIFFYYYMSSKYRTTFKTIFFCSKPD